MIWCLDTFGDADLLFTDCRWLQRFDISSTFLSVAVHFAWRSSFRTVNLCECVREREKKVVFGLFAMLIQKIDATASSSALILKKKIKTKLFLFNNSRDVPVQCVNLVAIQHRRVEGFRWQSVDETKNL